MVPGADSDWVAVGSTGETGPIAVDMKVVPLPIAAMPSPLRIRLRLTRGLWRIDYVALATLGDSVAPVRIMPTLVKQAGVVDSDATRALSDTTGHRPLTTFPGDAYDITYQLPSTPSRYEFFLESRGYYLEWLRREGVAGGGPLKAPRLAVDPPGVLWGAGAP